MDAEGGLLLRVGGEGRISDGGDRISLDLHAHWHVVAMYEAEGGRTFRFAIVLAGKRHDIGFRRVNGRDREVGKGPVFNLWDKVGERVGG